MSAYTCASCKAILTGRPAFCPSCGAAVNYAALTPTSAEAMFAALPRQAFGGFWIRYAAYFVDSLIAGIGGGVLIGIAALLARSSFQDIFTSGLFSWISIAATQLYHALFVSSSMRATPGKAMCGLVVTDLNGRRLSFLHALGRNLAAFFSYITFYVGYFMAGWTERRQALHDKMAGTYVVRKPFVDAIERGEPVPTFVETSGAVVVVVVIAGAFVFVAFVGILAAIAIPAYQDYVQRAKVAEIVASSAPVKVAVGEFAATNHRLPASLDELKSYNVSAQSLVPVAAQAIVESASVSADGAIAYELTFPGKKHGLMQLVPELNGEQVRWRCQSEFAIKKYMPIACR